MTSARDLAPPGMPTVAQRVLARGVDLAIRRLAFAALILAVIIAVSVMRSAMGFSAVDYANFRNLGRLAPFIALASGVALGNEPVQYVGKSTSWGKSMLNLEIRLVAGHTHSRPVRRLVARHVLSVAACVASTAVTLAAAAAAGMSLTAWRVIGMSTAACMSVWLSVILTAICRSDRRGWNDLATGTMLVDVTSEADRRASLGRSR